MTVREFDGTDDVIIFDAGDTSGIDGGPVTVAVWMKPDSSTADLGVLEGRNSTNPQVYGIFLAGSSGGTGLIHGGTGNFGGFDGYTDAAWQLFVYTKPDGDGQTVRCHVYDPVAETWSHGDGGTADDETLPVVQNRIGEAFSTMYRGRIAVAAVWSSVVGNDAAVEALGLETSLSNWVSASPAALWPLNQASTGDPVEDLTGGGADQTSITGTTVVNGDDPPSFQTTLDSASSAFFTSRPNRIWRTYR